jgi:hypothetical protein
MGPIERRDPACARRQIEPDETNGREKQNEKPPEAAKSANGSPRQKGHPSPLCSSLGANAIEVDCVPTSQTVEPSSSRRQPIAEGAEPW